MLAMDAFMMAAFSPLHKPDLADLARQRDRRIGNLLGNDFRDALLPCCR